MLEIDLNDDVVFEAVLETLRRRVKIVCWREMFMASDFEIVRDTNSKLEIKVQREGMFGTSRVSDKFENKLREMITYDVALFASRHYCFRVDGTLQPADRIADTKTNGDDDKSPFLKRIVSKRTENDCFPEGAGSVPRQESQPTWGTPIGPVGTERGYY